MCGRRFSRTSPAWGSIPAEGTGRGHRRPQGAAWRLWKTIQRAWSSNPCSSLLHPPPAPPFSRGQKLQIWINATPWRGTWLPKWFQRAPVEVHGVGSPGADLRQRKREAGGASRETHPALWSALCAAFLADFVGRGWGGGWSWCPGHPAGMDSLQCASGGDPGVTHTSHLVLRVPLHGFWSLPLRCVTLASGSAFWGPGLRQELGLQEVARLTVERLAKAVVTALSLPLPGSKGRGREGTRPLGAPPRCSWLLGRNSHPAAAPGPPCRVAGTPGVRAGAGRSKQSRCVDHSRDQARSQWSPPLAAQR